MRRFKLLKEDMFDSHYNRIRDVNEDYIEFNNNATLALNQLGDMDLSIENIIKDLSAITKLSKDFKRQMKDFKDILHNNGDRENLPYFYNKVCETMNKIEHLLSFNDDRRLRKKFDELDNLLLEALNTKVYTNI